MKDLGIIKEKNDFHRLGHNMVSFGTLDDGAANEEIVSKAVGHHIIYFGYSDYGGDIFEKLCCQSVCAKVDKQEIDPDTVLHENTAYSGEQMLVLGELADKIAEANNDPYRIADAIGFDLDEDLTKLEYKYITNAVDYMVTEFQNDGLEVTEEDREFMFEWLEQNGRSTANDWDFNSQELEKVFKEERKGVSELRESVSDIVAAKVVYDKDADSYTLMTTAGDEISIGSVEDAREYCRKHGLSLVSDDAETLTESTLGYPTALEYSMVSARENAKKIIENAKKIQSLLETLESSDMDSKEFKVKYDGGNLLWLIEQEANLIVEHSESLKDKLAAADKAYAEDMELVKKASSQSAE